MREIKFRMWNQYSEDEGIYIYSPDEVYECIKQQVNYSNGEVIGHDHNGDGSVFEQYTGIKDKNGKEIYEGDVVMCPVTINKHIWGDFQNRVVKWKKDSFTWVFDSPYSWGRFEDNLTGEGDYINYTEQGAEVTIEIIGNIHENPELLKL